MEKDEQQKPEEEPTTILVADDDPSILRVVEMMLTRQGFRVVKAQDGEEAFHKAVTEKPSAILLDIRMPKMDGLQVCSKLKATESTAAVPIAFLTAEKEIDYYKQAHELGSLLYITKPFKPDRLIDVVGLLLSSRRKARKR